MQAISLNHLSQETVERLQRLAQEHGSDIQAEAVQCLERGLSEREQIESELHEIRKLRESSRGVWLTEDAIRSARDEGRA